MDCAAVALSGGDSVVDGNAGAALRSVTVLGRSALGF